ncbi:hypothetical protein [Sporosarcina sp. G11-34]|uniref:hypothetical protein n=1 Tax=Sporosarcina sp. G11-34 TaxID=2849605 RepID=UPI0022A9D6DE|nr:hypothetical protein [Sporosarcina sp. G11-34]MCZ2258258.1 hypothetical protein [Sporosarcina sp. G11-34]
MRKKLLISGLALFVLSAIPLFQMVREVVTDWNLNIRYKVEQTYAEQGFPTTINVQEIEVKGHLIEIVEEQTGKKGSLTLWDREEGVEAGDIVRIHILVDGKEVTQADEIWLSNRDRGSRYYSWLDILTVNDKVAIVQRLTDDDEAMNDRRWKIIWIDKQGDITDEKTSYQKRNENPLAVRLINVAGTSLMSMGYYSDILKGYHQFSFLCYIQRELG